MFTPSSHHNNFFSGAYARKVRVLLFFIYFRTVTGFPRTCDFSRTVLPLARRSSSARDCNVNASTIALSAVYRLQFLPLSTVLDSTLATFRCLFQPAVAFIRLVYLFDALTPLRAMLSLALTGCLRVVLRYPMTDVNRLIHRMLQSCPSDTEVENSLGHEPPFSLRPSS